MSDERTSILVTGLDWMGGGIGSIESALEKLFQKANDEILITVYSISNRADLLFNWLEIVLSRGVETKMVVNKFSELQPSVANKLQQLTNKYPHFLMHDFVGTGWSDLHAKVVVVDRNMAIVGSSNLSRRGMLTNYELAVLVEGDAAVTVAKAVDRLIVSECVTRI